MKRIILFSLLFALIFLQVAFSSVEPEPPQASIRVSDIEICWASLSNRLYQVQYRSEVTGNAWTDLGGRVQGSGVTNCVKDEVTQSRRFYRIVDLGESPPGFEPPTNMVRIAPGTFTMGSPASELERKGDEGPLTTVTIPQGFWIGRYEVTQQEYQDLTATNPSQFQDPMRPVEKVSWDAAVAYCVSLTIRERNAGRIPANYSYRLPTEAEWEYVYRAGSTTRFSYGADPGYTQLGNYGWYTPNSTNTTQRGGLKLPNAWGVYDMSGNVWEWCEDWYATAYSGGSVEDPRGPSSGTFKIQRGGAYNFSGTFLRCAARFGLGPEFSFPDTGFRVVLAPRR